MTVSVDRFTVNHYSLCRHIRYDYTWTTDVKRLRKLLRLSIYGLSKECHKNITQPEEKETPPN